MPPKEYYNGGIICFGDGMPIARVEDVHEVTITENPDEDGENTITLNVPMEYTATFTISRRAKKRFLNLFMYGWRAKGHLRRKALQKALKLRWNGRIDKWPRMIDLEKMDGEEADP